MRKFKESNVKSSVRVTSGAVPIRIVRLPKLCHHQERVRLV